MPQPGSPLLDAGANLGQGPGFTGALYGQRDTVGAYQVTGALLTPQGVAGLPPTSSADVADSVTLPAVTDAGLPLTYAVESGPAQIDGQTLTFKGAGTVVLLATQAGDDLHAPFSAKETITVTVTPPSDTPALPTWALITLGMMVGIVAMRSINNRNQGLPCSK